MSNLNGGSPKNLVMVAGSFRDDLANQKGHGYSVTVSSGVYTVKLDKAYDGLVSVQATVLNASAATGESLIANIVSYSVTDGTAGGTVVLNTVDDTGAIETTMTNDAEIHFSIVLEEDTTVYGYDAV
tara:strand:- start:974 stop:1354 length:381 start_codon:yes stop_codon:yes gene_type:complete